MTVKVAVCCRYFLFPCSAWYVALRMFFSISTHQLLDTTSNANFKSAVFYLRIMVSRWQRITVKVVMAFSVGLSIVCMGFVVIQCYPVSYIWQRYEAGHSGKCLPKFAYVFATTINSVTSAVLDWALALLPLAMLWGLQMNRKLKLMLLPIMSLGALWVFFRCIA